LSADAVPVIVESLPEIGDKPAWQGYTVERAVLYRWDTKPPDWRTYNLGRSRAHQSVQDYVETQAVRVPATAHVDTQ